jgi:hypothetical protein
LDQVADAGEFDRIAVVGDGERLTDLGEFVISLGLPGEPSSPLRAAGAVDAGGEFDLEVPHAVVGVPGPAGSAQFRAVLAERVAAGVAAATPLVGCPFHA